MADPRWNCYPAVAQLLTARTWLQMQADLDRSPNAVAPYGRNLEDYLTACRHSGVNPETATRADIARYVRDLNQRSSPQRAEPGLSNATMQRRLTVVRLYSDYLVEETIRTTNPVGRGRYTPGQGFGGIRERGLSPRYQKRPWIPNEEQWRALVHAVRREPIRNRCMFALAYDCALRREELCTLATEDIEPGQRLIHIRAEHTKNRQAREVIFSPPTLQLYAAYLVDRRQLTRARGPLFLSWSNQNKAQPITIWTWSKVVQGIAERAGVPQFTTHTFRHLCLTDLARAGWDVHEIAQFAGHRAIQTTLRYTHRSGRELAAKVERGMDQLHAWRAAMLAEETA